MQCIIQIFLISVLIIQEKQNGCHYHLENKYHINGYENIAINKLLEKFSEDEIITLNIPKIKYTDNNKQRIYFPDIYIPKENLIIEIKSTYTYKKHFQNILLKKQATINQGYNFQIWICSDKHILEIIK